MKKFLILLWIFFSAFVQAQEEYFVGQTRFIQKTNPSYFGFNSLNRVGVLYNTLKLGSNQTIDNKYFFGALSFDEKNFSLGVDFNSFRIDRPGLIINRGNLSYIYKVQLKNRLFFLPSISLGIGSSQYNDQTIIFEDQLDQATGFINTQTIDPTGLMPKSSSYFDLGASFIIHSDEYLVGVSLKHLNRPNVSYNQEVTQLKPIEYNLNGAYEFDINPYDRGIFPKYSYILTYGSATFFNDSLYFYFSQELQLGEFSVGISQQVSNVKKFNLNNIGFSVGLSVENFDFGILYNFPIRVASRVYSPSIFELYLTFDFSKYRRNNRGLFKRIQIDNYY